MSFGAFRAAVVLVIAACASWGFAATSAQAPHPASQPSGTTLAAADLRPLPLAMAGLRPLPLAMAGLRPSHQPASPLAVAGLRPSHQPASPLAVAGLRPSHQAAPAAVIYSQPPSPSGGLLPSSLRDPDGSATDQWVWDGFTLGWTQDITEVQWRGGYNPAMLGSGGPVFDFTVAIYASIPSGLQPDLAQPPLVRYEVGGNANQTPAEVLGGVQTYDYQLCPAGPLHGRRRDEVLGPDRSISERPSRLGACESHRGRRALFPKNCRSHLPDHCRRCRVRAAGTTDRNADRHTHSHHDADRHAHGNIHGYRDADFHQPTVAHVLADRAELVFRDGEMSCDKLPAEMLRPNRFDLTTQVRDSASA